MKLPLPRTPLTSDVFIAYWSVAYAMRVRVHVEGVVVVVGERVAGEVVAGVVLLACRATPDRGLLGGLDPFGAGEQAARRDAVRDERAVVGPAGEVGALERLADAVEVPLEGLLDLR